VVVIVPKVVATVTSALAGAPLPVNVSTSVPLASSGPAGPLIAICAPGAGRTRKAFKTQCGSTPPAFFSRTFNCVPLLTTKLDEVHCPGVVETVVCSTPSTYTSTRSW
jgi:hypothetical protein